MVRGAGAEGACGAKCDEGRPVLVGLLGGAARLPLPILSHFTGTLTELIQMAKNRVVTPIVTGFYQIEENNEVLSKAREGEKGVAPCTSR